MNPTQVRFLRASHLGRKVRVTRDEVTITGPLLGYYFHAEEGLDYCGSPMKPPIYAATIKLGDIEVALLPIDYPIKIEDEA